MSRYVETIHPFTARRPARATGPFAPILIGSKSVALSSNSWLVLSQLNNNATRIRGSVSLNPGSAISLHIRFNNGIVLSTETIDGMPPSISKYQDNKPKKIEYQTDLYCPLLQVHDPDDSPIGSNDYVFNGFGVSRYVDTNLMLMESCEGFFLIGGPAPSF
jgi:hypothetical protein